MKYVIYPDEMFLRNFIMDLMILFLICMMLEKHGKKRRMVLAATVNALAATVLFFLLDSWKLYQAVLHLVLNPCMTWMSFRQKKIKNFLYDLGLCYVMTCLSGGLLNITGEGPWRVAALVTGIFSFLWYWKGWRGKRELLWEVKLKNGTKVLELSGFYDTGNRLTDPFTGRPVHLVSRDAAEKLLTGMGADQSLLQEKGTGEAGEGRFLVPYQALGVKNGLIETRLIEALEITKGGKRLCISPAEIGIAEAELFTGKKYEMIINGKIRNGADS